MHKENEKIRVLVVDDTQFYRAVLSGLLSDFPDIEVVDTACDAYDAREKIKHFNPDVLTLDIEMPGMNGLDFLDKVMTLRPMPVVIVSTLSGPATQTTVAALQLGAVDCIGKPVANDEESMNLFAADLADSVRAAACAHAVAPPREPPPVAVPARARAASPLAPRLIAMGASTGGVETLTSILTRLPDGCPPIVMTQHMPPGFTASFAARLSQLCPFRVYEAADGMALTPGMAALAPGGRHLRVVRQGAGFALALGDDPPVSRHRPSVNVLFASVARAVGRQALGVILTGMGDDGAEGMLAMRQAGALTLAEDQASCVVYGMPGAAVKCGAAAEIHSLQAIPQVLVNRCFA